MRKLVIPESLKVEFETVKEIWHSSAETRRVDCLILSWVKYEKQLRRLFSFFVFQHPKIQKKQLDQVISAFASNRNLNPETFIAGLRILGIDSPEEIIKSDHEYLWPQINRIRKYRNKIMHGQHTGQAIGSSQLEVDVLLLVRWISSLGEAYNKKYGYDGIRRRVYFAAKNSSQLNVSAYPFSNAKELKGWLSNLRSES